ncbi:hypothetical protein [Mesorhizobium silamurunense]|uniref:hypothetical protein n=1 Tax=Mesorhizobium silamurunense TaxID=499528 RepID=UPI00177B745A|nr:hypothetical protein [Mesorhizobium silamurunense]
MSAIGFCILLMVPLTVWMFQAAGSFWRDHYRELARVRADIRREMIARARDHE